MMEKFRLPASAEGRLILELLGRGAGPAKIPQESIEWESFLRITAQHEITSTLYERLPAPTNESVRQAIPIEVLERLRDANHTTTLENRFLAEELLSLLDLFASHGIPAVPFKGPDLAVLAYHSLSARQFADLDIFIHKHDLDAALKLLFTRGYQFASNEVVSPRPYERYHRELRRQEDNCLVELHWDFAPRHTTFSLDRADLWNHLISVALPGGTVQSFSVDDLLIILCVHGAKHVWYKLKLVCDIAELLRVRGTDDWDAFLDAASQLGTERKVFLGLALAHGALGVSLPANVLDRIHEEPIILSIANEIVARWFDLDKNRPLPRNSYLANHRYNYFLNPRFASRWLMAQILLRRLVSISERDKALVNLPAPLTFLYYFARPFRLLAAYGLPWARPRPRNSEQHRRD